jgi:hypothetical protein
MPKWLAPKVQPMYAVLKLYDVWFAFYTTPFCIRKSNGQQKWVLLELPGRFSLDGLRGAERRQSF